MMSPGRAESRKIEVAPKILGNENAEHLAEDMTQREQIQIAKDEAASSQRSDLLILADRSSTISKNIAAGMTRRPRGSGR